MTPKDIDVTVSVIGGGLAGCEAAYQLAIRGVRVHLYEMRPLCLTPVHKTDGLAELVCSNSLKSMDVTSAAGLLKYEIASMGSFLLLAAMEARVPAGGALAVDRERFSDYITRYLTNHPKIEVIRDEVTEVPSGPVIIATGPLTSDSFAETIERIVGGERLAFFDAAAPIVETDSLNHDILFAQSRYDRGGTADYLNAPMDRETYDAFIDALVSAEKVIAKDFEKADLFSACQPVEEVARTGHDALRYGALKPVGLTDKATGRRPWAAVQLRAENAERTSYNLVGFQTNLTFPEQRRVFRMIPGLENAEFSRYGVMHRNTFIDTPHTLDETLAVPGHREIRFAGQITGTEGYTEAIASGLFAALNTYADICGLPPLVLPSVTAFGSLLSYATDPETVGYQPMHVNYGIIPPFESKVRNKRERYAAYSRRAREAIDKLVESRNDLVFSPRVIKFEGVDDNAATGEQQSVESGNASNGR